jgi:hypothetical protein
MYAIITFSIGKIFNCDSRSTFLLHYANFSHSQSYRFVLIAFPSRLQCVMDCRVLTRWRPFLIGVMTFERGSASVPAPFTKAVLCYIVSCAILDRENRLSSGVGHSNTDRSVDKIVLERVMDLDINEFIKLSLFYGAFDTSKSH